MLWYYMEKDQKIGPMTDAEFQELVTNNKITPGTRVKSQDMYDWKLYMEVKNMSPEALKKATEKHITSDNHICSECKKTFQPDELIKIGNSNVCDTCKLTVGKEKSENKKGVFVKLAYRVIVLLIVVGLTNFFIYWILFLWLTPFGMVRNIVSLLCAFGMGWHVWKKTENVTGSLISHIFLGAIITGSIGFALGFFGPMILSPNANQGPLLGIFITGPLGFLFGGIGGYIYGLRSQSIKNNSKLFKFSTYGIWFGVGLTIILIILVVTYVPWRESKYSSIICNVSDLTKRDKSLTTIKLRSLSDEELLLLGKFTNLNYIDFWSGCAVEEAKLTDKGLNNLSKLNLSNIEWLMLGDCKNITDVGIQYIAKISTIKYLSFASCPQITDAGIQRLTPLANLEVLDLRGCSGITDEGLISLGKMPNIKKIELGGCNNITNAGIEKLRSILINADIEKDDQEWSYHKN